MVILLLVSCKHSTLGPEWPKMTDLILVPEAQSNYM